VLFSLYRCRVHCSWKEQQNARNNIQSITLSGMDSKELIDRLVRRSMDSDRVTAYIIPIVSGTKFHLSHEKQIYFQYLELFHECQILSERRRRVEDSRKSQNRD
jgi:uncharacterized protein YoaH (UPF0181 family)